MAVLYTSKEVNAGIQRQIELELAELKKAGILPTLATVRVGERGADISYEKGAIKRMRDLSLGIENIVLPADASQTEIIECLKRLGGDPAIHGILLFQPLPGGMDEMAVKSAIPFIKDVDCATAESLGAVMAGSPGCLPYCAPAAVMELLSHYGVGLKGKYVTIVGSGLVVGKPLSMLMVDKLATVSLCNIFTPDIAPLTRQADILVSACGVAGLISGRHVREGQIVVDVGTTYENGKLLGDVNLEEVSPIVAAVTPTPGGVSGITSTVLAKHVVLAAKRQAP